MPRVGPITSLDYLFTDLYATIQKYLDNQQELDTKEQQGSK
jgi:hypothetical protein